MDKKIFPVGFHGDMPDSFVIDLTGIAPGSKIIVSKSDGSQEVLTVINLNTSYIDNPLTGNIEFSMKLSLQKPVDDNPKE